MTNASADRPLYPLHGIVPQSPAEALSEPWAVFEPHGPLRALPSHLKARRDPRGSQGQRKRPGRLGKRRAVCILHPLKLTWLPTHQLAMHTPAPPLGSVCVPACVHTCLCLESGRVLTASETSTNNDTYILGCLLWGEATEAEGCWCFCACVLCSVSHL